MLPLGSIELKTSVIPVWCSPFWANFIFASKFFLAKLYWFKLDHMHEQKTVYKFPY